MVILQCFLHSCMIFENFDEPKTTYYRYSYYGTVLISILAPLDALDFHGDTCLLECSHHQHMLLKGFFFRLTKHGQKS